MKIGILTFHRALNYGAVLQCYALQETLKRLGHDVYVLDYRPKYIEKYRRIYSSYSISHRKGIKNKIKEVLVRTLLARKTIKARDVFNSFLSEHINVVSYKSLDECNNYDIIIVGSDQVWSPTIGDGFDKIFWGCFPHSKTKLLSYAASIGGHNVIDDAMWYDICGMVRNFDNVSVREDWFSRQLSDKIKREITTVLDPTLLVDRRVYENIQKEPEFNKYLILFLIVEDNNALRFAKEIAQEKGLRIVRIKALQEFEKRDESVVDLYSISPQAFLGYFARASFIVTNSFHGTAFSLIYRRNFYSLDSPRIDRAKSLLHSVNLENRIASSKDTGIYSIIDYSNINQRIERLQEASLKYLLSSLSE